jgi:hypothetical protein
MQVTALLYYLGLACAVVPGGEVKSQASSRPDRIINEKHGFSVIFPKGWFMFDNGDVPAFYNFSPEKSIQGNLPVGGASIELLVRDAEKEQQSANPLLAWADQEIGSEHGINVGRQDINGPTAIRVSRALRVSFDRKALGTHAPSLHFVIILWQFKSRLFGAQLSYIKNDPKASQHERTLSQLVGSFKPT